MSYIVSSTNVKAFSSTRGCLLIKDYNDGSIWYDFDADGFVPRKGNYPNYKNNATLYYYNGSTTITSATLVSSTLSALYTQIWPNDGMFVPTPSKVIECALPDGVTSLETGNIEAPVGSSITLRNYYQYTDINSNIHSTIINTQYNYKNPVTAGIGYKPALLEYSSTDNAVVIPFNTNYIVCTSSSDPGVICSNTSTYLYTNFGQTVSVRGRSDFSSWDPTASENTIIREICPINYTFNLYTRVASVTKSGSEVYIDITSNQPTSDFNNEDFTSAGNSYIEVTIDDIPVTVLRYTAGHYRVDTTNFKYGSYTLKVKLPPDIYCRQKSLNATFGAYDSNLKYPTDYNVLGYVYTTNNDITVPLELNHIFDVSGITVSDIANVPNSKRISWGYPAVSATVNYLIYVDGIYEDIVATKTTTLTDLSLGSHTVEIVPVVTYNGINYSGNATSATFTTTRLNVPGNIGISRIGVDSLNVIYTPEYSSSNITVAIYEGLTFLNSSNSGSIQIGSLQPGNHSFKLVTEYTPDSNYNSADEVVSYNLTVLEEPILTSATLSSGWVTGYKIGMLQYSYAGLVYEFYDNGVLVSNTSNTYLSDQYNTDVGNHNYTARVVYINNNAYNSNISTTPISITINQLMTPGLMFSSTTKTELLIFNDPNADRYDLVMTGSSSAITGAFSPNPYLSGEYVGFSHYVINNMTNFGQIENDMNSATAGTYLYPITVQAKANNNPYLYRSSSSNSINYTTVKLATPVVIFDGVNVFSWNVVSEATKYNIYSDGEYYDSTTETSYTFNNLDGFHNIQIAAVRE